MLYFNQMELAGKLAEDGHLICGDNLVEVKLKCVMKTSLVELNLVLNLCFQALLEFKTRGFSITPFQPGNPKLFSNFLDNLMGGNNLAS